MPAMTTPNLTRSPDGEVIAIMVVWNGLLFLPEGVASVLRELRPQDDLLIVENGSTDGSAEWLHQHYPDIAVLQTGHNLGGAGGFNAGMTAALRCPRCRYVWLLDNDIIVESGALPPLLNQLAHQPNAAAAGSQICLYQQPDTVQEIGALLSPWLGALQQRGAGGPRQSPEQPPAPVDYLAACSLLIRADVLRAIGLFPDFFIYYDDVEWSQRAGRAGWTLWAVPASVIRHHFSGLKPAAAWREYYRKRNRTVFLTLYPPRYGRQWALFVYLIHLHRLILHTHWCGHTVFHQTYTAALQDALNGQLGARALLPSPQLARLPDLLQTCAMVWIDLPGQPGDAQLLARLLQSSTPAIPCQIIDAAQPQNPAPAACPAAIVGENYRLHTARRAAIVYRYRDGHFTPLHHPVRDLIITQILNGLALLAAMFRAIPDFQRLRTRYRQRQTPLIPD